LTRLTSLTLRQLTYFVVTAEMGQVAKAAAQLSISQPAITTAIRDLEALLGAAVFNRTSAGMDLTAYGKRVLGAANAILSRVDDLMNLPGDDSPAEGEVSLATTYTVLGYFLTPHLQRLGRLYPKLTIRVHELPRDEIESGLLDERFEMAIVLTSNIVSVELKLQSLVASPRRLWVHAQHPLLRQSSVTLADVAAEPYVMLTVDEAAETAARYWSRTPHQPKVALRTSSVEAVRSMVANGNGVAILSDMVYRPWSLEGKRIETVVLTDQIPSMEVGLAWNPLLPSTPAAELLRSYFTQLYLAPGAATGVVLR
jgi:DNA-binding transcriptional LysR family regulator